MKNSPILLTLFACFAFTTSVFGQAGLERQVTGAAGSSLQSTSGATLHFTIGEVMVSEHHNGTAQLSQGFHQVLEVKTLLGASTLKPAVVAQVEVFPNPAQDFLQVNTDTPLHATLFDLNGRQVLQQAHIESSTQLQLSALPTGTYLLRTRSFDGKPIQSFKIQIVR